MRTSLIFGALGGAVALIAAVSAQEARTMPGLGTGIVNVRGTVEVANALDVRAAQAGPWRVALEGPSDVRVASMPVVEFAGTGFVTRGRRYDVVWSAAERERVTVEDLGQSGWVRVVAGPDGRRRWVNLSNARSVEEQ